MKNITTFVLLCLIALHTSAQYHDMAIPGQLSGYLDSVTGRVTYNLVAREAITDFLPGQQTITAGYNDYSFLGPTLVMNKWDNVQINLINLLNDTTTMHWHGIHLPAVMDGGPHQPIPPGAIWQPYWTVMDHAATFWYHPHLHGHTNDQVRSGLAGLIIVHDSAEAALALPRTYGVDDIPLVITDRKFDSGINQFDTVALYGDTVLTNGTLNAQYPVPAQVVRFRILGAAQERCYVIGFADSSSFSVITTDGGLLNAPVPVTRYLLSPGERIEILANFTGRGGTSLDLMAFNDSLARKQPGGIPYSPDPSVNPAFLNNKLGHRTFRLLHINIGAALPGAITTIPASLVANSFPDTASVDTTRDMKFINYTPGPAPFVIDSLPFEMETINKTIPLNNKEIWSIHNNSTSGHIFHIHDIQFLIISRTDSNGNLLAPRPAEEGWKDVFYIDSGATVRFITRFTDFEDSIWAFMYHCHMLGHEDLGMMGQFLVVRSRDAAAVSNVHQLPPSAASVYPIPATDRLFVELDDKSASVYYIIIFDMVGRTRYMLPNPDLEDGINIRDLKPGNYVINIIDSHGNRISKNFIKH